MKTIANAEDSLDIDRVGRVGFDLKAQVADVHIQRAVQAGEVAVGELVDQVAAGEDPPGEAMRTASSANSMGVSDTGASCTVTEWVRSSRAISPMRRL